MLLRSSTPFLVWEESVVVLIAEALRSPTVTVQLSIFPFHSMCI